MLTINLSPVRVDRSPLDVSWAAPVLRVDGVDYDLSLIPDCATVDHPIIRNCTRNGNDYELTLSLPHGQDAPQATRFPQPVTVSADGPVNLPFYAAEVTP